MFALPSGYVAAQEAGKTFAADYYGRLNASAESVVGMFSQRSRYYSMDSLNGRPAVGRADIVREVRRFLGTYSGGRRSVCVMSVDAQIDADGRGGRASEKDFDRYDTDDCSDDNCDLDDLDDLDDHDEPSLAVFVRAEWTDMARRSLEPMPFVQTFRVRCLRAAVHGYRFKIDITIVKTMVATVQPPLQGQHSHRRMDANHNHGFSNSECGDDNYRTPISGQFQQETYAGYTKRLNAEAREFELWSPPNLAEQSTDDEQELSEEGACDAEERESTREHYLAYRNKVKVFLEEPMFDLQPSTRASVDDDDDDDEDSRPTDLLRVDRLDKSVTADQLYAAFSRYGKVQWVRVFPGGYSWPSGCVYPYHSARVCFDRTESVDRVLADHQSSGCTIKGVPVNFSKSKPGQ
ncbi:uncharacterized protein LOC132940212 [Metopolophium dirhodum]|uniref:uncharacterized protein LOC132940212 n=1 Tax=Metopolophium dirhodum TaxID=44670 RepID=UPI002990674C|nr:uncharacterized protein LOC132940212 [Metopolophium dirhodum]XP_060863670.1 uncharacterized protein LOC132940212 [Metopolophium dirhodum]